MTTEDLEKIGRSPFESSATQSDSGFARQMLFTRISGLFVCVAVPVMILWLVLKDWLTSYSLTYPYADSFAISFAIVVAGIGAYVVRKCKTWRDFVVFAGVVGCILCCRYRGMFPTAWFLMPGLGILLCSFCFPLPGIAKEGGRSHLSSQLFRPIAYVCAFLFGAATVVSTTYAPITSRFDYHKLIPVVVVLGVGYIILICIREVANKSNVAKIVIGVIFDICWLLFCVIPLIGFDKLTNWSLTGSGLYTTGIGYNYAFALIGADGILSVLFKSIILIASLQYSSYWLLRHSHESALGQSDESRDAHALCSCAITAILTQLILCQAYPSIALVSSVAGTWNLALSITALVIAGRALANLSAPVTFSIQQTNKPLVVVSSIGGIIALILGGLWLIVSHIASGATSAASFDAAAWFVPIERMPLPVLNVVNSEGWQVNGSGPEVHDTLRHYFGPHISVEPSMASLFGNQLISDWLAPRCVKEIFGSMVGCVLSAQTPNSRIEELYLNYRDYGAPSPGLNAASSYFFQRPMNTISDSDARFLLARQTTISDPFSDSDSDKYPKVSQDAPTQYDYDEFPIILPQCYSILHDGAVNRWGKAVGTMLISGRDISFLCYRDKEHILNHLPSVNTSFPFSINDNDQLAGDSYGADGNQHAVTWDSRGVIRDIGSLPGYSQSIARCINNKGQIVGYVFNPDANDGSILSISTRAFLWQNGHMTDLGVPSGYLASRAYGMNDNGQIAGWVLTRDRAMHAMVWGHGHMQDIGTLGGEVSIATSINNRGQVVGDAERKDGTVGAFLWENGVMHDLGNFRGDIRARAWSINDSGEVVGLSFGSDLYGPGGAPFVWDSVHGMRDLISMLTVSAKKRASLNRLCTVFSVNDSGQILGVTLIGRRHMFLLTPHSVAPVVKESEPKR